MLKVEAPFPQVGSYALLVDATLPLESQRAELVRIQRRALPAERKPWRDDEVTVSFPLRTGATGHRTVAACDLSDATPLSKDEVRELHDLSRDIAGRDRPNAKKLKRANALRQRLIMSEVMAIERRKLAALEARQLRREGGSTGTRVAA